MQPDHVLGCGPPSISPNYKTYKLLLVGDSSTGKSTFLHRHLTGDFERNYMKTNGPTIHPVVFPTNYGSISFEVLDIPPSDPFEINENYLRDGKCAIIMFDVTSMTSYENVAKYHQQIVKICGNIPIVLCGNKVDSRELRKVSSKQVKFHKTKERMKYYDISVRSNFNFEKPFLWLARELVDSSISFFYEINPMPPNIDEEMMEKYEQDLKLALENCSNSMDISQDDEF